MTVLSIQRDFGPNVNIVRMVTTSSAQDVASTGWLAIPAIAESIIAANNGTFEWSASDVVLIHFADPITGEFFAGANFYIPFAPDFQSLNPMVSIFPTLQNVVAHAGGGQANATPVNVGSNVITVVATIGDSVILPADVLGQTVIIYNAGANVANVFPNLGDSINGMAANAPLALPAGASMLFIGVSTSNWVVESNVTPIYDTNTNVVAHAGGGQANATPLILGMNNIVTVATANDSVRLPATVLGQTVIVVNLSSNSANIFPAVGNAIDGNGLNNPYGLPAAKLVVFYGMKDIQWFTVPGS